MQKAGSSILPSPHLNSLPLRLDHFSHAHSTIFFSYLHHARARVYRCFKAIAKTQKDKKSPFTSISTSAFVKFYINKMQRKKSAYTLGQTRRDVNTRVHPKRRSDMRCCRIHSFRGGRHRAHPIKEQFRQGFRQQASRARKPDTLAAPKTQIDPFTNAQTQAVVVAACMQNTKFHLLTQMRSTGFCLQASGGSPTKKLKWKQVRRRKWLTLPQISYQTPKHLIAPQTHPKLPQKARQLPRLQTRN